MPKSILKGGGIANTLKGLASKGVSSAAGAAGSLPSLSQGSTALAAKAAAAVGSKVNSAAFIPNSMKGLVKNATKGVIEEGAKQGAEQAATKAVNTAVKNIPGGANAISALGKFGVSKTQIANTAQQLTASAPSILQGIQVWFNDPTNKYLVFGSIVVIIISIIIGLSIYFSQKSKSNFQNVEEKSGLSVVNAQNVANALGGGVVGMSSTAPSTVPPPPLSPPPSIKKEKFENATLEKKSSQEDMRLVNLQPLTIKQTGYVGPLRSGVFSERDAVQQSLRAGFRTFILQIDYHEDANKGPPSFPIKGEPSLLYRDDAGVLVSLNAGSIRKTAEAIADLGFGATLNAKYDPIILILHGIRAPDSVTNPKGYLDYCSKIATQLKALAPYHLGLTAQGDYHRQALAGQMFSSSFSQFEKKIIILSTFDTTLFRKVDKLGISPYAPVDDLDYWVNAQLFKEDEKDDLGVANVMPANGNLRSSIVDLNRIMKMTPQEKKSWSMRNRDTFTVALSSQNANPSKAVCDNALSTLGVNVIPLDIFCSPIEETRDLLGSWEKKTWHLKPLMLRATVGKGISKV
jgi:hypothetical protein